MNKLAIVERDMEALLFKVQGDMSKLMRERDELVAALSTMLGAAETDCMDDKSNVWRSAMIDARAALAKVSK